MLKTPQKNPDVMTIQEAAEFLRVAESTVRRYAVSLMIPGRQLGKEWRFSRSALEEWLRTASGKEVLLSQAGSLSHDREDLDRLRKTIYEQRGRPELDDE
jgi:excisionase family DNA binding protein